MKDPMALRCNTLFWPWLVRLRTGRKVHNIIFPPNIADILSFQIDPIYIFSHTQKAEIGCQRGPYLQAKSKVHWIDAIYERPHDFEV